MGKLIQMCLKNGILLILHLERFLTSLLNHMYCWTHLESTALCRFQPLTLYTIGSQDTPVTAAIHSQHIQLTHTHTDFMALVLQKMVAS